jgi:hypothetical protein
MKDDKKKTAGDIEVKGTVVRKTFGAGSKSEHEGIFLETAAGESFKLKRMGGNPFNDPELTKLLGKEVTACGVANQNLFIAKTIKAAK